MKPEQIFKAIGAVVALVAIVLVGMSITPPRGQAQGEDSQSEIQQGFAIAPVPLNLEGKNRSLVGLGSYIVNAQGDCNGCHSAGPATEFVSLHNPYFRSPFFIPPMKVNPATYLGGGRDFGPFPGPAPNNQLEHLFSRNLTPDKTGLPEGGHTFAEFLQIIRTGADFDHVHPNCSATVTTNCLLPPFNGDVLQVMPWPTYHNMTERDLGAIYQYLSCIPHAEPCNGSCPPSYPNSKDCPNPAPPR